MEVWTVTDRPAAAACPDCGTVSSRLHETVVTRPRDVRRAGDPVDLRWVKRRWKCAAEACTRGTFTEWLPAVPPRCRITRRRLRSRPQTTMTRQQVHDLIEECADIAADLRDGDPADMASAYRKLGLRLTYHPERQLVSAAACPKSANIGKWFVSEGGLEHTNAGNIPGSGKSCRQNTGPLAGGVNPVTGKLSWTCTCDIRASAEARGFAGGPPSRRLSHRPPAWPRSAAPAGPGPACSRRVAGRPGAGSPSVIEGAARQTRYQPICVAACWLDEPPDITPNRVICVRLRHSRTRETSTLALAIVDSGWSRWQSVRVLYSPASARRRLNGLPTGP